MINQELEKYIKSAITAGLEEYEIIINLLNAGWGDGDVDNAVKEVLHSNVVVGHKKEKHFNFKMALSFLLIIVGVSMVAGTLYVGRSFVSDINNSFASIAHSNTANIKNALMYQKLENLKKKKSESTLLFVGDIMLSTSRGVGKEIKEHKDVRYPFLKIANKLRSADLTFGNLEGPISSRGKDKKNLYSFRSNPKVIEGLKYAGFDVLSIANNHIYDWGKDAFLDTLSILKSNGINPIGGGVSYKKANEPLIEDINGVKIAFLAYSLVGYDKNSFNAQGDTPGKSSFDLYNTEKIIKTIKREGLADIVVVSFHWGNEYKTRSNLEQQNIAHSLVNSGADMIVGHHPHVVEELERYKNGWISYSLGNFIFDQSFSKDTMQGLMLKVKIDNKTKKILSVSPIGIKISKTFQPEILQGK